MHKQHVCTDKTLKKCLIHYHYGKHKDTYDLASYCSECHAIRGCIDNSERIAVDMLNGKVRRRVKSDAELLEEFEDKYPIFEITNWEQGYLNEISNK